MDSGSVVALAGGVGGAKLAQGLAGIVEGDRLSVIVNTADDFDLWGLHISPDLDTVMYTLAGIANPITGWGIAGDTHHTLAGVASYGEDPWFSLGDRDVATHILRTERLRRGDRLTGVTGDLASALGVRARLLPMTDDPVATMIHTNGLTLAFQDYFVARRHQDEVEAVSFAGIDDARPTPEVLTAIETASVIVLCPSNPIVSIGPILEVPGMRKAIQASTAARIGVSPIVGGKALKGPADRMLASLGLESSALGIARMYQELLDVLVIDHTDRELAASIEALGMRVLVTQTVMGAKEDRQRLAGEVLASVRRAGSRT
ncbi:MAG: 2-phospho-L-lactate transferase [Chloroflexia bacterium]|nr:2-phospho-L-lactate transferase [Chloroflexia bacterium]